MLYFGCWTFIVCTHDGENNTAKGHGNHVCWWIGFIDGGFCMVFHS